MADNNLTANSSLADEMQATVFEAFKTPMPARTPFDFKMVNNAPLTDETVKASIQSLSVIRDGLGLDAADFSPETVRDTISALALRSELKPNPEDFVASLVHVPAGANAPIDPSIIKTALSYLPASVAVLERAVAASAQPQVQPNTAAVTPTSGAAPGSAATSASTAAVPQADNTQSVKAVETMLSSFGINVGKVDGTKDPQFDAAVSNLKDIIKAVVPTVSVSAGAGLTQGDIAALKTGIETFAASQQFKDLQMVRTGKLPVAPDASMLDKSKIAGAEYFLSDKSEAERIAFALEQKAGEDPALAEALKKVPTSIIDKMPTILDTLGKPENRNALIAGLQAVYAPPASASSVANTATTTQATPAQPAVTTQQTTTTQPAPVVPDPAGAQGTTPTQPSTPAQSADDKVAKASVFVETVLYEKITPVLDDFAGKFSMLNIKPSDILPVLTQEDVGGDFDVKSQRMAATTIMGLKSLAGIEPADGTYNEAIGNQLKLAILTDDKMQMVRDAFEVPKMGVAEAKALLSDEKQSVMQAQSLHIFFDSLNTLEKAKKLDRDKVAQSTTTRNMMLDGLALGLDKWAPGLKDTLKDFFMNSEIGQMAGAVLAAFGINVGRLWGDKDDAAAMENAKPTISRVFNDYITEAQNQLGPNAPFNEVMAKTRENVMDKLENSATFNLGMKAIFGNADKDTIKNAIDKALAAAESAPNAQAATEQYANTIVELGKQYSKGEKIDFDKAAALLAEAQQTITSSASDFDLRNQSTSSAAAKADPAAVTAAAATGTTPNPAPSSTTTTVPATSTSSTAPAAVTAAAKTAAAVTSTSASATPALAQNSAASVVKPNMAQATTTVANATQVTADMASNKIDAGNKLLHFTYIPDPKDYVQKLMPSEGRVKAMLEVVNENAEALSMSLPMSMTKGKNGQIVDLATKPVCAVLEELSIRAHVAQQLRNGEEIDTTKLDRKIDEVDDIRAVASYMLESGVESKDVDKFRKAAESLRADATLEKGFINTPQLSLVQVDALVKEMKAAAPVIDPNAVKVDPNDAALYQRYRDLNAQKGKGPDDHCVPLVFMAREENGKLVTIEEDREAGKAIDMDENNNPEGYNVYVGIVVNNRDKDPTNDQFKVMEVKDFIKNELHVGLEDPVYDALRKDYSWSDTVGKTANEIADLRYQKPTLIDTTIKNALCLNDPAPELAAKQDADAKPKAAEPVADAKVAVEQEAKKANVEQPRPFPRRYSDLLPEPFRISQNEAENLDGGKLNLNEMYEKVQGGFVHMGTAASGYPAFKEGPYMVTPLENKADREKLGGDVVISRMMNGEMYHSVIDTKKDKIIHPDDYSKVKNDKIDFFRKDESPKEVAGREFGDKVKIGLDEFLDRNIAGQNTHNDRNGTLFTEMAIVRKTDSGYGYGRASDHIFGLDKYADFSKGDKLFEGAFDRTTTPEQIKEYAAESAKNAEIYRKLTNDYINEHVARTQARVMAEHKIGTEAKEKIEITSTNVQGFGKASGESTFSEDGKPDPSKAVAQNISDMGIAEDGDMSADVGGFNYQQRRSLAYGGAVA